MKLLYSQMVINIVRTQFRPNDYETYVLSEDLKTLSEYLAACNLDKF